MIDTITSFFPAFIHSFIHQLIQLFNIYWGFWLRLCIAICWSSINSIFFPENTLICGIAFIMENCIIVYSKKKLSGVYTHQKRMGKDSSCINENAKPNEWKWLTLPRHDIKKKILHLFCKKTKSSQCYYKKIIENFYLFHFWSLTGGWSKF